MMESDIKKRRIRIVGLDRLTDDREDKNGNRRVTDAEIRVPIVRGSIAFYLGKKATEQQTHRWSVYVRGATNEDLGVVIKQVIFKLHPSFDNPIRMVNSPPFILSEYGWGEFKIDITIILHTAACEAKVELSHYLRLNAEEDYGHKSLKRPVIVESFIEIVFPDPFESFLARVHNHPAVWISKLPNGFKIPPPGNANFYDPTKKGDTQDHPLSKWFFIFSEAKELSKITARQQVQVQIAKLKQQLDDGE